MVIYDDRIHKKITLNKHLFLCFSMGFQSSQINFYPNSVFDGLFLRFPQQKNRDRRLGPTLIRGKHVLSWSKGIQPVGIVNSACKMSSSWGPLFGLMKKIPVTMILKNFRPFIFRGSFDVTPFKTMGPGAHLVPQLRIAGMLLLGDESRTPDHSGWNWRSKLDVPTLEDKNQQLASWYEVKNHIKNNQLKQNMYIILKSDTSRCWPWSIVIKCFFSFIANLNMG